MTVRKTGNTKQKQHEFISQKQEQIQARQLAALPHDPLKLQAQDAVDLKVISALLQDAIVPATNFKYDSSDQTFTILANRFCWEESPERLNHRKIYGRIQCCLQFHHVHTVQHINIDRKDIKKHYNLLSIDAINLEDVLITFSDSSKLRLKITELSCVIRDIDEMWYTTTVPKHDRSKNDGLFCVSSWGRNESA